MLRASSRDERRPVAMCRCSDTVPGISWVLAYTIAAEIGDIARFASPRKLAGYSGLCPRVYQSGERDLRGPLSKQGPRYLRWALVEPPPSPGSHRASPIPPPAAEPGGEPGLLRTGIRVRVASATRRSPARSAHRFSVAEHRCRLAEQVTELLDRHRLDVVLRQVGLDKLGEREPPRDPLLSS